MRKITFLLSFLIVSLVSFGQLPDVRVKNEVFDVLYSQSLEQPNAQKVFNYLLKAYETEVNVDKMVKILDYIKGSGISLELYTYDSFLFDVPTDVDKELIRGLKEVIEEGGFPVKASWGKDYGIV